MKAVKKPLDKFLFLFLRTLFFPNSDPKTENSNRKRPSPILVLNYLVSRPCHSKHANPVALLHTTLGFSLSILSTSRTEGGPGAKGFYSRKILINFNFLYSGIFLPASAPAFFHHHDDGIHAEGVNVLPQKKRFFFLVFFSRHFPPHPTRSFNASQAGE